MLLLQTPLLSYHSLSTFWTIIFVDSFRLKFTTKWTSELRHDTVELYSSAVLAFTHVYTWPWPLTSDLENFFSNSHSRHEYLCQISLKSFTGRDIESREIHVNGQRTTDRRPEVQPDNIVPLLPVVGCATLVLWSRPAVTRPRPRPRPRQANET